MGHYWQSCPVEDVPESDQQTNDQTKFQTNITSFFLATQQHSSELVSKDYCHISCVLVSDLRTTMGIYQVRCLLYRVLVKLTVSSADDSSVITERTRRLAFSLMFLH